VTRRCGGGTDPSRLSGQQFSANRILRDGVKWRCLGKERLLLQVIFYFLDGSHHGVRFVLSEFLAGATLPQQVPALIQRLLELCQSGPLVRGVRPAGLLIFWC